MDLNAILTTQKQFFQSGATRERGFRERQLQTLLEVVQSHETEILGALKSDMGKPPVEAYGSEIAILLEEIRYALKKLPRWMKTKKVATPLWQFPARSRIYSEPKGVCLILGPWNYPFQLVLSPLVGALSAGNCAVLKPSEFAPETSRLIHRLLSEAFDPSIVKVVEGEAELARSLTAMPFDHIFFTGGTEIGRHIMRAAADRLTPVTLELGGKSPCVVDTRVDLKTAVRRITWGKFVNAGQTCVAPDYLMVHGSMKTQVAGEMKKVVEEFFGTDPARSPDYARIIHRRHFDRLQSLLPRDKVLFGGESDPESLYFAPTLIDECDPGAKIMEEEIFGPLLPIVTYKTLADVVEFVNARPRPLAFYFFTSNGDNRRKLLRDIPFGGGCVNDTLIHLANPRLPFGGTGDSGMGAYHGKTSFETFSHQKSILHRSFAFDARFRYPPYGDKLALIKRLF